MSLHDEPIMQIVSKEGGASYYEAPKVLMPQWNDTMSTNTTIHHSQTQHLQMHVYRISVQCCCLVMQSEANQC